MSNSKDYNSLFYYNPLPNWVYDRQSLEILDVNQAALDLYGYSREEFLSMTIKDLRPKSEIPKVLSAHTGIDSRKGNIYFGVFTHMKKSGGLIRMEINGHKVHFQERDCIMVSCQDVTIREKQFKDLEEFSKKLNAASEIAKLGYWKLEMDANTLSWSDRIYEIWGRKKEDFEVSFPSFFETIHPDDRGIFEREQELAFSGEKELNFSHRIVLPDGKIKWVREIGRLNKNEKGEPVSFEGTVQDITLQKQEEQHLKLLESVITHTHDAVLITEAEPFDEPGPKIIYVNEAFTKMTGYTAEEVIGKSPRILQGPNSDREELARLGRALRNWESCEITTINYKKNGEEFWINFSVSPVADENGWYTHWIAIEREITEQKNKELENKLLRQISQSFNEEGSFFQAANQLCQIIGEYGKFDVVELWSPNIENTHFQFIGKLEGNPIADHFYNQSLSIQSIEISAGLQGQVWKKKSPILLEKINESAVILRLEAAKSAGLNSILGIPLTHHGELVSILVLGTSEGKEKLTKSERFFEKLDPFLGSEIYRKKLEGNLSHLYDAIPDLICLADFQGRFLRINKAGCDLLGYEEEELLFHSFDEFVHPEDRGISRAEVMKLSEGSKTFQFENRYLRKNGEIIWLSWTCNSDLNEGLIYASAKDISREKKLRELNQQASRLAKIGSWEIDLLCDKLYWSEIVHELHETDPKRFVPNLQSGINFYREDFRSVIRQKVEDCIQKGVPFDFEAVLVTAKGNEKWVRVLGNPEFLNGKCIRIYGSFQDIHDRKTSEEVLKESEAKFRTIFDIASLGIAQVSPGDGKILLVNAYYEEITGYSLEEMMNMRFLELTHPDDRQRDWELFSRAAKGEVEYRNEKRYIRKDGSIVWVRIHLAFIRDDQGKPIKTVAICENITERKEIESRLKNLSDNVPGVVFQYVIHPDGKDELHYVSRGSKSIWGFEPEQAMADNQLIWKRIEAGGDLDLVQSSIAESIQNNSRWNATWKYPMPSGEIRTHIGHGSPEYLADGTVLFNSLILDITEEKRTEDLLQQATSMAKIGSWELDLLNQNEDAMYWSPMTRKILGVHEAYNPTLTGGFEFYTEESRNRIQKSVERLIQEGLEFDEELLLTRTDGEKRWIRCIGKGERLQGKCVKIFGSFQDIHASKSLENQISEILGSISDAFYAVDQNWNFTYFNKEAEKLLQRKSDDVLGKDFWEEFAPAKGTMLEEVYRRVAETEVSETFEYLYPGNGCWYEINTYPSNGGLSSYFKNIDERKKAEKRLQKAYEEKNRILESIGDAFFALDKDWKVTYWNRKAEEIIGIRREDLIGYNLWEKFPEAKNMEFFKQYQRSFEEQVPVSFQEYFPPFDQWFEANGYPTSEGISVFFRDITIQKKAEKRILEANERFEMVTQVTTDAIWDWDIENKVFARGEGFEKLFGYPVEKKMREEEFWKDSFHPEDLPRIQESLEKCLADPTANFWELEYRILHRDGAFKNVIDKGLIIRNKKGLPIRMVGAITDISERIKYEQELKELNLILKEHIKELQMTNEQLEQFAFIASHDLQEPLRMISSFLNQLERKYGDQLDDKARQYIHFATDGAKRMKQTILDLLDYSRAGKVTEEPEQVDLNELIGEFKILRRKAIQEKGVKMNVDPLPVLKGFKAPLTQTFHCLLDNAIKYSREEEPPEITLSVKEEKSQWRFQITDNGIGIDPKFFDKIFIIFQRLHDKDTFSGTGIGLSIAKKQVEFMGGKIWVDSTPGKGSTFYFILPKLE